MSRMHHRGDYRQGRPASSGIMLHGKGRQVICPNRAGPIIHHHRGAVHQSAVDVPSTLLNSLISWWNKDEVAGVRVDEVGGNDLTDNNTVLFAAGQIGNAASFVAAQLEYLSLAVFAPDWAEGFCLSFWVQQTTNFVLSQDNGSTERSFTLLAGTFYGFQTDAIWTSVATAIPVDANFHHVIIWWDPIDNKLRKEVDGANAGVSGGTITGIQNVNFPFFIGRYTATYTTSKADLFGIWNRPLTVAERAELYNGGAGVAYPF